MTDTAPRAAEELPQDRTLMWRSLQVFARLLTTLVFDLRVYGREHVPTKGGVLLLANHQSYLDPVLLGVRLYRPISYMARADLFRNRFFRWLIRSLHAFPVKQGAGDVGAIKETIRRLQEGHILNIYPEGGRTFDGQIQPIQSGVALVLRRITVPIVPVVIDGSFEAWPRWKKFFRPHPIRLMYGPPIHCEGMKADQIVRLVENTLRRMFEDIKQHRPANWKPPPPRSPSEKSDA
jgi:1-acyl-sn-glycerol-3-phosphate acyltransferase